jgi:hypothetical protein
MKPMKPQSTQEQIEVLKAQQAEADARIKRMQAQRAEIAAKPVLDEGRKKRFLRKLDNRIAEARREKTVAGMRLQGVRGW